MVSGGATADRDTRRGYSSWRAGPIPRSSSNGSSPNDRMLDSMGRRTLALRTPRLHFHAPHGKTRHGPAANPLAARKSSWAHADYSAVGAIISSASVRLWPPHGAWAVLHGPTEPRRNAGRSRVHPGSRCPTSYRSVALFRHCSAMLEMISRSDELLGWWDLPSSASRNSFATRPIRLATSVA